MQQFRVTKKFTAGILAGLTYTEVTPVKFKVGFECLKPVGGSPYVIVAMEEL